MDALSQSVSALTQTVSQMNGHINSIDGKLKDISDKVSLLNQPAPAPPPAVVVPDASGAPPGITRLGLWQDAEKDYASNNDEYAVKEYSNFIKYFKDDSYAPEAGYKIGMIYAREKDYDGAAQAFQDVIDHYPGMNRSQDALYQKAKALAAGGHKMEAIAAYKEFLSSYPANDYVAQAKAELAKLQPSAAGRGRGRGGSK
jgi:TolA-binding protein